jgi:hypothetical protein
MSRSNRPQVLGLVIITPATSGPSRAVSAARSTRPSAVAGMFSTEARKGRRRRIGAMRAFGHQDDLAGSPAPQRGLDAQHAAQLAMRPGLGRHGDAVHAGQRQPVRQFIDHFQRALHRFCCGAERVDIGKTLHPRDLFVQARIVLHRARPERERAQVDGIVLAA